MLIAVAANTLMNLIPVMAGIGPAAGFLAMGALTLTIYRLVPNRTFRIRQLWPGAVVSGVLIELITLLFPLYAKLAHGFDTYGQSLALFFLLATWLAFLSQFILIGALWNRVRLGEEFTASGLLATRAAKGAGVRTRATRGGDASPSAPSSDDAVAAHVTPAGGDSIAGDVDTTPHPAPGRSRRAKTTRS
jgi:hypothetical protein